MMGLTPDAWGAIGTVAGVVGMAGAGIMGTLNAATKKAHDLEADQMLKDIKRVDDSQKAAWIILDDLRFNAARRQDQDKLREEFRADVRALGDRLEAAISALRDDIHRGRPGGA